MGSWPPFVVTLNENSEEYTLGSAVGAEDAGDNVVGESVVGSTVVGTVEAVGAVVGTVDMVGESVGDSVTQTMLGHAIMPQHSTRHSSFVV